MLDVYIAGEDEVTRRVIYRILNYCSPEGCRVLNALPARGGEIKKRILEFNQLAAKTPVILLTDLDANPCAPTLKKKLLKGAVTQENFIFNIAVDEAESWLMADREGFAKYMSLPLKSIPEACMQKQGGNKACMEMQFNYKSSYFLTHVLAEECRNETLKAQLCVKGKASKGKEYNAAILPFVNAHWDIEVAMKNSDSLARMVNRINKLLERHAFILYARYCGE